MFTKRNPRYNAASSSVYVAYHSSSSIHMNIRLNKSTTASILIVSVLFGASGAAAHAKNNDPFSGEWVSKQYTNGKEFHLKIQQDKDDIVGWEGRLPPQQLPEPDFVGKIDGKEAEIEVTHRRGYKAHVKLSLRGDRLVWQLIDATGRSSRYFPLASTLIKQSDLSASDKVQTLPYSHPSGTGSTPDANLVVPVSAPGSSSATPPSVPTREPDSSGTIAAPSDSNTTSLQNKSESQAAPSTGSPASSAADSKTTGSDDPPEPKPAPDFRQSSRGSAPSPSQADSKK